MTTYFVSGELQVPEIWPPIVPRAHIGYVKPSVPWPSISPMLEADTLEAYPGDIVKQLHLLVKLKGQVELCLTPLAERKSTPALLYTFACFSSVLIPYKNRIKI